MKKYIITGHLAHWISILLAAIFSILKVTVGPTAENLFQLINSGNFYFPDQHYAFFIVELPTLIAIRLGAGLDLIASLYAVSFPIFYYGVFLIITYAFRQPLTAICITLLSIQVSFLFAYPDAPMLYSFAFVLLFYASLTKSGEKELKSKLQAGLSSSISILFLVLALLAHPIAFFAIAFVLIYNYLEHRDSIGKKKLIQWLVILLILFGISLIFSPIKKINPTSGTPELLFEKIFMNSGFHFLSFYLTNYFFFCLLLLAFLVVYLLAKNEHRKNALLIISVCLFLFFSFFKRGYLYELEHLFLTLFFFVFFVFSQDLLSAFYQKKRIFFMLLLLLASGFYSNYKGIKAGEERQAFVGKIHEALKEYEASKFLLDESQISLWRLGDCRYFGEESMLVSALKWGNGKCFSFYNDKENNVLDKDELISLGHQKIANTSSLNADYFPNYQGRTINIDYNPVPRKVVFAIGSNAEHRIKVRGYDYFVRDASDSIYFEQAEQQVSEEARSGNHSVKTWGTQPYGFSIKLSNIQRGDIIRATVYRKGNNNGGLVISEFKKERGWYSFNNQALEIDENGWALIETQSSVPFFAKTAFIYVWNSLPETEAIYFDDINIEILRE